MLIKKAQFNFIDIQPLNTPVFGDNNNFLVDQHIKVASNIIRDTMKSISLSKLAFKEAEMEIDGDNTEFDLEAEVKSHPDSLYVKCFAIKADETNDNGDHFSYNELKKATSSFIGVPVFTNHQNTDAEEARGKVVHSWWDEDRNGIMIIARVDAEAYPKLARGIKEEYIMGTSMGASRGHDLVSMSDGTKKRVDEIQIGDTVITHTGGIEPVTAIVQTQEHSQLYHIRWNGNKQGLALSYEHPVLILRREDLYRHSANGKKYRKSLSEMQKIKPEFVPASEIRSEDYVLEIINPTEDDSNWTEDQAFLMGVYAAEGYVSEGFVEFCFGANDPLIAPTIEKLKKFTNGNIREIDRIADRNGYYVRVYDPFFAHLCLENFGTGSHNKRPSVSVENLPKHLQKILLGAYIDGDGCIVKERTLKSGHSSGSGAMQISSASLQLLRGMRRILLRLGISSTISSHNRVATASTVVSNTTEYVEHMLYISNSCHDVLKNYSIKVASSQDPKQTKADSFFFDKYIAHRVKDVVLISNSEPTYYMQIGHSDDELSDHSYILNDIATHNCQVKFSLCSICHNLAETPDQYCSHIKERKTRKISAKNEKCNYHKNGTEEECPICNSKKGETKKLSYQDQEVFEYNYGIKFIENSFVVNPACHDCGVTEIIDPQEFLKKVASITERILKVAQNQNVICDDKQCVKIAGQKELDQLGQALDLMTSVSQSMLKQKDQLDLEFLADLVKVVADLQKHIDELAQQGYGSLQSPQDGDTETPSTPGKETNAVPGTQQSTNTAQMPSSKITTGPAGEAGTVTSPTARRKIDITKIGDILQKKKELLHYRPNIYTSNSDKHLQFSLDLNTKKTAQ